MNELKELTQLFLNAGLTDHLERGSKVTKKRLVNALNYINFQDGAILVNMRHIRYGHTVSLVARPQPCLENTLSSVWVQKSSILSSLPSYRFVNFLLKKDGKVILVEAEVRKIDEEGITFLLPEVSYEVTSRKAKRYACEGIRVQLLQEGIAFPGRLLDFSSVSFRMEIEAPASHTFQWINTDAQVYAVFCDDNHTLYSGECRIIRQASYQKKRIFVLEPVNMEIRRFRPEKYRSERFRLTPSPHVGFRHPLTGKMVTAELDDLSCSGFSVEEYHQNSSLFPGLIIPELNIQITEGFSIRCKAQVVYKTLTGPEGEDEIARYGMSILDMETKDQVNLSAILHRVSDRRFYVCSTVELDELWQLFFEAGFVYPEKYLSIFTNKEQFKETYNKLYLGSPSIARHFIHRNRGAITGHIAMIRFYENTWLMHHHAAVGSTHAGLAVLDQVSRYIYDYRGLYSTHMDFVMCYFRPENKFPNRVFGGFAEQLKDRKGCSVDPFAYFHFSGMGAGSSSSGDWGLAPCNTEDLIELRSFYEGESGGLTLNALDLEPDMLSEETLSEEYRRLGFKRERRIFSLKQRGELKVVFLVTVSDTGLNLSSLTNCIHVIILDSEGLTPSVLYTHIGQLSVHFGGTDFPVLVYPASYAEKHPIPAEKTYNLWVINAQYGDNYLEHMENLHRHTRP